MIRIATLFYNPVSIPWQLVPWLIIPLCVSIAIIYKTIRTQHPSLLPREIARMCLYIAAGLVALCIGAVVVYHAFL